MTLREVQVKLSRTDNMDFGKETWFFSTTNCYFWCHSCLHHCQYCYCYLLITVTTNYCYYYLVKELRFFKLPCLHFHRASQSIAKTIRNSQWNRKGNSVEFTMPPCRPLGPESCFGRNQNDKSPNRCKPSGFWKLWSRCQKVYGR